MRLIAASFFFISKRQGSGAKKAEEFRRSPSRNRFQFLKALHEVVARTAELEQQILSVGTISPLACREKICGAAPEHHVDFPLFNQLASEVSSVSVRSRMSVKTGGGRVRQEGVCDQPRRPSAFARKI